MANKKNKSFVKLKETKTNNKEIITDPLSQYEYIEPKKKLPIKQIILVIGIIVTISLVIIFLKIINSYNSKPISYKSENLDKTKTMTLKQQITTTRQNENTEQITEILICSSITTKNNIQFNTIVTANFYNRKLRSDENFMSIKLLDESERDEFNNYATYLQMLTLSLIENGDYEIDSYSEENEFGFSIKTIYEKDKIIESNLSYDEDYDVVKQKLIDLGHTCKEQGAIEN